MVQRRNDNIPFNYFLHGIIWGSSRWTSEDYHQGLLTHINTFLKSSTDTSNLQEVSLPHLSITCTSVEYVFLEYRTSHSGYKIIIKWPMACGLKASSLQHFVQTSIECIWPQRLIRPEQNSEHGATAKLMSGEFHNAVDHKSNFKQFFQSLTHSYNPQIQWFTSTTTCSPILSYNLSEPVNFAGISAFSSTISIHRS